MAITKEKKKEILLRLRDLFGKAASMVFVSFKGLSVSDATALRSRLRQAGVSYWVAKKTLVRKALEDSKVEGDTPELPGELALAYTTQEDADALAPARGIRDFQKEHKDKLVIVGGILENAFVGQSEMQAYADVPGRDVLYAQFVNLINSPIQGMVVALNQIAENKK